MSFTNPAREDLATRLLLWYRDNRLRLPRDQDGKALHAETIALRRIITKSGAIAYEVPRTALGHGDRLWSLALALKGASEPPLPRGMGVDPLPGFA